MRGRTVALLAIPSVLFLSAVLDWPHSNANKARMFVQETGALKTLQTLNTAQVQYNSQFGRYARSLAELGPPACNLIPADLAGGEKQGYIFTLAATPQGYSIQAVPVAFGSTGSRTFYTDQSLVIRENYGPEPAAAHSKEAGHGVAIPTPSSIGAILDRSMHIEWNRSRMHAQETAALKALQTLNTAQVQYNCRFGRYARSLTELGPSAANLIPASLAAGENQGYRFTLTGTPQGYTIQAVPMAFGSTGSRNFCTDQSLIRRENYSPEPATSDSQEVGSATKQPQD